MQRRRYLSLVGASLAVATAGCPDSETGSSADSATNVPSPTQRGESTLEETTTATTQPTETTPTGAAFEIVAVDAPETIEVAEPFTVTITVENVGGQAGTFEATVQEQTVWMDAWRNKQTLRDQIPAGEKSDIRYQTTHMSSDDLAHRLQEYDEIWGFEVAETTHDVAVTSKTLLDTGEGQSPKPQARLTIQNNASYTVDFFDYRIEWFDPNDTQLGRTISTAPALAPSERTKERVSPRSGVESPAEVASFTVELGVSNSPNQLRGEIRAREFSPPRLSVVDSHLSTSTDTVTSRVSVKNERENAIEYTSVFSKAKDQSGAVLGYAGGVIGSHEAGETRHIEQTIPTAGRAAQVTSQDILLTVGLR